jgi:hypothetical protein
VRVKREKDEFIEMPGVAESGDGVFGERFPVAHGDDADGVDVRSQGLYEMGALAFGEDADGRAPADLAIAFGDRDGTARRNQARQGIADEVERTERNDVRIAKEIAEEGLDVFERVRASELEEDNADAFFGSGAHWFRKSTFSLGAECVAYVSENDSSGAKAHY